MLFSTSVDISLEQKNEILNLSNGDHIASRIDIPYNTPKKSPDSTVSDNFHTF
jgi:hypothetical protein